MIYGILNCAAWLANAGQSFVINTVTVGCARAHPHHINIAYSSSVVFLLFVFFCCSFFVVCCVTSSRDLLSYCF